MQAYKLKGEIDQFGQLIITEPIKMTQGEVEVILLKNVEIVEDSTHSNIDSQIKQAKRQVPSKINALKNWFAKTEPTSSRFDPDQARWEALQEKHNL